MKATSNVMPERYLIEAIADGTCDIVFATNIVTEEVADHETGDTMTQYVYDLYRIRHPYSDNLADRISDDYDTWLELAVNTSLRDAVKNKIAEVKAECEKAIYAGVTVETQYGVEHFALSTHDQQNLSTIKVMIDNGAIQYPYHADGKQCVFYSAADFGNIIEAATRHVTYHTTYCNMLKVWINRCQDCDIVDSIYYGIALPEDLARAMAELLQ